MEMPGEEGDDDMGDAEDDADVEDRVVDLEDALDDLKAEFEKMMSGDSDDGEEGDEDDAEEMPDMDVELSEVELHSPRDPSSSSTTVIAKELRAQPSLLPSSSEERSFTITRFASEEEQSQSHRQRCGDVGKDGISV